MGLISGKDAENSTTTDELNEAVIRKPTVDIEHSVTLNSWFFEIHPVICAVIRDGTTSSNYPPHTRSIDV